MGTPFFPLSLPRRSRHHCRRRSPRRGRGRDRGRGRRRGRRRRRHRRRRCHSLFLLTPPPLRPSTAHSFPGVPLARVRSIDLNFFPRSNREP